ncbi:trehalose-phosphatase [Microbacterium sp.]|uniref:trehalose-phosphatase n=1 Tax=Microbacterium sp. TaxID=51671 RepID=UPI003A84ABF1
MSAALEMLAATDQLLVALDFDGTLSELVDDPMTARMTPAARAAVDELRDTPGTVVALVSGRSLHDLREIAEHTDGSDVVLAGSHGAEFWMPGSGRAAQGEDAADAALRGTLRAEAETLTANLHGVWIEPKTFGFGVHTRRALPADAERAHEVVGGLVRERAPHWRRRVGHNITEYAFRAEGKDTAVAQLREQVGATAVLFAGDDVTDEDAIASLQPGDLGIRVGPGPSSARVRVADIDELAATLTRLARLRTLRRAQA